MPSRSELNARARVCGFDPAGIANDSKLEQKVLWLEKNAAAVTGTAAISTLTSNNTNVSNNDTVTIGSVTYTFKTTLVAGVPYQVFIGADADTSLGNLIAAINGSATPGTSYTQVTPRHPFVTAGTVSSHAFTVTAKETNVGADLATTKSAATLTWTGATLNAGTPGVAGVIAKANVAVGDQDSGQAGDRNTSI